MSLYSPLETPIVSALIRKHVHDLRNCVNYLDLEFTLLEDELGDASQAAEVSRLRGQLGRIEQLAQVLSLRFSVPSITEVAAGDVFARWQRSVESLYPVLKVNWQSDVEQRLIYADLQALSHLLTEVLKAADDPEAAEPLAAQMTGQKDQVIFRIKRKLEVTTTTRDQAFSPWQESFAGESVIRIRMAELAGGHWEEALDKEKGEWVVEISVPSI